MIMSLIAGKAQHAVKLLPVRQIEAGVVEAGMERIVGGLRLPGGDEGCPGLPVHDRLTEIGEASRPAMVTRMRLTLSRWRRSTLYWMV